jgi:ankyrin repeat protein
LQENAKRYDLINNDKFGEYVQMCFEDMLKPERKERLKTLLICSINHAMAIKLHIKSVKNNPLYVVSFYDPNITNEPVRCETGNLQTFKNHTLEEYINGTIGEGGIQGRYNWYFPESNPIAMVLECDLDQISNKPVKVEKKLTLFASDLLTPTHIYYLLANNFHHDLDQLWNRLKKSGGSSLENLFTLVAAKNSEGTPGLWWALQDGHAEVIKIYKKFLPEFCESEYLIDLLAAKDEEGTPALYMALQNGHTEAIKAYGELLQFADSNYLVELLAAKDEDGTPGLCMALRYGRADTIREYGKLIQSIPGAEVGDLVDILAAKASNEVPGLSMALIAGHGAAIEAYGELLQLLGLKVGDNLIKLLAAIDEQGTPGFYEALRYGHAGAIKAYGQLLQLLPSNERDELIGLLAAKKENGMSGLFAAFLGKHTAALKAYRQLLRQLSEKEHKQLFDLLGATSAMESEEVVEGYKELLQALSKWHAEFSTKK